MNINNELQEDTKLQDEGYAVLSKVGDKILIVPFEYNQL